MDSLLLDVLAERVLIYDGAMGTQLQAANLTEADFALVAKSGDSEAIQEAAARSTAKSLDGCNEILSLTRPDVVEHIHAAYLEAGADLIETNTFGATSIVLAEYQIPELVYDISLASGQVAKRAAVPPQTDPVLLWVLWDPAPALFH